MTMMTMKLPVGFPCGLPTRRNMSWIRESTCVATLTLHLPPVVGPQPFVQQYQKKNFQSQEEILRNEFLYFLCDTFSCALSCLRIPGGPLAAYKPTSRWHCWPYRDPLYNVWKHVKIHKSHNDFEKFHSFHEIHMLLLELIHALFPLSLNFEGSSRFRNTKIGQRLTCYNFANRYH